MVGIDTDDSSTNFDLLEAASNDQTRTLGTGKTNQKFRSFPLLLYNPIVYSAVLHTELSIGLSNIVVCFIQAFETPCVQH